MGSGPNGVGPNGVKSALVPMGSWSQWGRSQWGQVCSGPNGVMVPMGSSLLLTLVPMEVPMGSPNGVRSALDSCSPGLPMGSGLLLTLAHPISHPLYTFLKVPIRQHLFFHSFDYAAYRAILFHLKLAAYFF